MMRKTMRFVVSVATPDLEEFETVCAEAGWAFTDSGERVTTETGLDGEAVVVVEAPIREREKLVTVVGQ